MKKIFLRQDTNTHLLAPLTTPKIINGCARMWYIGF